MPAENWGCKKMALRERTAAGCGGGGGMAQSQCVFLTTLAVFEVCQVDEYILTRDAVQGMTLFETSSCFCLSRSSSLESQEELKPSSRVC